MDEVGRNIGSVRKKKKYEDHLETECHIADAAAGLFFPVEKKNSQNSRNKSESGVPRHPPEGATVRLKFVAQHIDPCYEQVHWVVTTSAGRGRFRGCAIILATS